MELGCTLLVSDIHILLHIFHGQYPSATDTEYS